MAWDQEKKDAVIEAYLEQSPTPETSIEIVKELAEENYELKKRVMPDLSDKIPEVTGK